MGGASLPAAFGGPGFSPRTRSLREEIGTVWAACGADSEWMPLERVLLHSPGFELAASVDPQRVQMLEPVEPARAGGQHGELVKAYRRLGVRVDLVEPEAPVPPNLVFTADLFLMTPEGAIVGRPASTVRAGEERLVAQRLAALGIPILRTVRGRGTFEGSDVIWLAPDRVMIGVGFRTNREGAQQVASCLGNLGIESVEVEIRPGAMHLMGSLRLVDHDLSIVRSDQVPARTRSILEAAGFEVCVVPESEELVRAQAMNFVTTRPRTVLAPAGAPRTLRWLESNGIRCVTVDISELAKAAGGIACMTGVLKRSPAGTVHEAD